MTIIKDNKAHGQVGLSFVEYLADFNKPTDEQRKLDNRIIELDDLQSNLQYPTNHVDKLRYLHDDFSIRGGDDKGVKQLNTEGGFILVMIDNNAETVNGAALTPNNDTPIISDLTQTGAFVIGSMSRDSDWWLVTDLQEAITLYAALAFNDSNVTVLVCLNNNMFNKALRHFAKVKTINITDSLANEHILTSRLAGVNAIVHLTPLKLMIEMLNDGDLISEIIDDAKTIDLQALGKRKPKPILQTLPPVKTLTKGMLPDSLQRYVDNNAERLSVPTEYVAIPTIISLASALGTRVSIFPKMYDDWEVVPNLWGAIIGNPSTKKSPALDAGMKPLRNLTYKAKDEYEQAQKDFATQNQINEYKAKAVKTELQKLAKDQAAQADDAENKITDDDLIAKAQIIADANQADEHTPMMRRHIANDSTYQKLGELLSHTNNGLLVERDELTGLLASLDGEGNSEAREFYLIAYNGTGSHVMDRMIRGSIFIKSHCLSIVGGIQPNKLERYLEKTIKGLDNDGLMQRFQLAVYPDHVKGLKEKDIAPDKETRQIVYDLIETIDNMTDYDFINYGANEPDDYHKRPYFHFTHKAFQVFMNWYDEVKAKAEDCEHSVIAEHMTKYPKTIASLALIFHIVDCIEHKANLGSVGITALNAALAWHSMLETHMNRIYGTVTDNANIKASYLADKIMKTVGKGADKTDETDWLEHGFTARQLIRKGWKGLTDADDVLNALEVLVEHNWLSWQEIPSTGQGGRPTERYFINSRLNELN